MSTSKKFLIIGLGNPGKKYEKTRHNVGFLAVDYLIKNLINNKAKCIRSERFNSQILKINNLDNLDNLIFAKPQTFMNNSGQAVQELVRYHKIKTENIIVIYDEIDLPFGIIRVRNKGSSAGHKGVQSIIDHLGTDKFRRIRIGIANEKRGKMTVEKFVLQKFSKLELKEIEQKILLNILDFIRNEIGGELKLN